MPPATRKNCATSSTKRRLTGKAPTRPLEADTTYEVTARLAASTSGPSVMAAQ